MSLFLRNIQELRKRTHFLFSEIRCPGSQDSVSTEWDLFNFCTNVSYEEITKRFAKIFRPKVMFIPTFSMKKTRNVCLPIIFLNIHVL